MSRIRPTTTAWGIFLALTGGVIIMVSSGTRFNLTTLTIITLTLLGVTALVLAVLPRPKPQAEVTVTRIIPDPNSPFTENSGGGEYPATTVVDGSAQVIDGGATQVLGESDA